MVLQIYNLTNYHSCQMHVMNICNCIPCLNLFGLLTESVRRSDCKHCSVEVRRAVQNVNALCFRY